MATLPETVTAYKRTPEFTDATIPAGLTRQHRTKAGVWGVIDVSAGTLRYSIPADGTVLDLTPETAGVVAPEVAHCVEPVGTVRFHVEFYR